MQAVPPTSRSGAVRIPSPSGTWCSSPPGHQIEQPAHRDQLTARGEQLQRVRHQPNPSRGKAPIGHSPGREAAPRSGSRGRARHRCALGTGRSRPVPVPGRRSLHTANHDPRPVPSPAARRARSPAATGHRRQPRGSQPRTTRLHPDPDTPQPTPLVQTTAPSAPEAARGRLVRTPRPQNGRAKQATLNQRPNRRRSSVASVIDGTSCPATRTRCPPLPSRHVSLAGVSRDDEDRGHIDANLPVVTRASLYSDASIPTPPRPGSGQSGRARAGGRTVLTFGRRPRRVRGRS